MTPTPTYVLHLFMAGADENIIERHELYLDELARMTLELARDQQQRALETDNPEQAAIFGRLYNATARSLRQTLALKARLDRECRLANRERREQSAARKARRPAANQASRWTEAERLDAARELNGAGPPPSSARKPSAATLGRRRSTRLARLSRRRPVLTGARAGSAGTGWRTPGSGPGPPRR